MNKKLFIFLFALPILTFSQQFTDEELLKIQLPMIYRANLQLFSLDQYSKEYEIDTLTKVVYFDGFDKNNASLNIDSIKSEISILETAFPGTGGKKQQVLDMTFRVNEDAKLPKNSTKIIEYELTDSNNKKISLRDSLGYSRGGGDHVSYQVFYLQEVGFGSIKGYVDIQFKFLTGYKNHKINTAKEDSLVRIQDKTMKILDRKENYILLKGDKQLLQKLEYSNVTDNNYYIKAVKDSPKLDGNGIYTNNGANNSMTLSSPSSKIVFPSKFFDDSIKEMTFNEYKIYFDEHKKAFEDQEYMCLIKFNTEILNLFVHFPIYEKTPIKRIQIDNMIMTR